jgi:hypothetical protein
MNPIIEKLVQSMKNIFTRNTCETKLGYQCSCMRPTDSELERLTGEPHFAGYPLQSGMPPARDMNPIIERLAEQAGVVIRTKFGKPVNLVELEKFADLVIEECCDYVRAIDAIQVRDHFWRA